MDTYKNIVFSGGGVEGFAYVGAIERLNELNMLKNLSNYAGSSIGSLFAALLACGCDIGYMKRQIRNCDLTKIFDMSWCLPLDIYRFTTEYGICTGQQLYEWIGMLLCDVTSDPDYTFGELWDTRRKNLVITGTDLDSGKTIYYSHINNPKMPIRTAIRISTSYPCMFQAVFDENGHVLVDGGVLDNYPIDIFDENDEKNRETIGLRLATNDKHIHMRTIQKNNPKEYIISLINAMYNQALRFHVNESDTFRTIRILTKDVTSMDFHITDSQKMSLVEAGIIAVNLFFAIEPCKKDTQLPVA